MPKRVVSADDRKRMYKLRYEKGWDLQEVYDEFPDVNPNTVRTNIYRERKSRGATEKRATPPTPQITRAREEITEEEEKEIWRRAIRLSRRKARRTVDKQRRSIEFDHGPVGLWFLGDLHLGGNGVDYELLARDIDIILDTPGAYIVTTGDLLDNYIVGRIKSIEAKHSISVNEQWVMVKMVLRKIAPIHIAGVGGNHDLWTHMLTHVDYLAEVQKRLNPDAIYDKYDAQIAVRVGETEATLRVRHDWKGSSIYNDSHGIERASKFDKGVGFDIGVGGHDHKGSLVREFRNGKRTGLAVKVGPYKVKDDYADRQGFSSNNIHNGRSPAPAVIIDEHGWTGTGNMARASNYLRMAYGEPLL